MKIHRLLLFILFFNGIFNLITVLGVLPRNDILFQLLGNVALLIGFLFFTLLKTGRRSDGTGSRLTDRKNKKRHKNDSYPARFLIRNLPSLFCIKDAKGRWLQASPDYLQLFNVTGTEYAGKTDLELSTQPGIDLKALRSSASLDKRAWTTGQPVKEVTTFESIPSQPTYEFHRTPIYLGNDKKFRLFVTGHRLSPKEAIDSRIFSSLFFTSHQAFLLFDPDFRIRRINASFSRLTGFSPADAINQGLSLFCHGEQSNNDFEKNISDFFRFHCDDLWSGEIRCHSQNGKSFPARLIISPITIENGAEEITYFSANIFDITQQKIDEKRIMQLAHYDDLTGLPNRVMFCERLAQFLAAAKRHQLHAVVMFLDLDRFKAVNDSLGHQSGDDLLKEVAQRLLEQTRKEDIVARFSGDEFAILLLNEQSHEKAIYSVSIIAQKIINDLSQKFYINRQDVFIGVSIGIAIYPEDANTVENLLKLADIAMYQAKKQGRNNFQFFHKKFTEAAQDKRKMEVDLRKALKLNEFRLYFQPQYDAASRNICSAEVLIRWFQNQTRMVPPNYFIPAAEDNGLIIPIGLWILQSACRQLQQWLTQNHRIGRLAVNISARQFMDPKFTDHVEQALDESGLPPQHLELEITESILIGDMKKIELQLNRLKKMGIKIALDDFGTGYSSLSYLKNFPIDILKIDQSFIREMTPGSKEARIACAIIDIGHSLGQKIVAEGVETEVQFNYLKQKGCDIIQGYYFSPPLPGNQMTQLLAEDSNDL